MKVTMVFWGTGGGGGAEHSMACHMKSGLEADPATNSRGLWATYPWQRA